MINKQAIDAIDKSIDMIHKFAVDANLELHGVIVVVPEGEQAIIHNITTE